MRLVLDIVKNGGGSGKKSSVTKSIFIVTICD